MFGISLPEENSRSGWLYEGNFVIIFALDCNSLCIELARRFFNSMQGYSFFGNNLLCSDKTLFGSDFGILGEGIVLNNKDGSGLRTFINLATVKEIKIDNERILWKNHYLCHHEKPSM